MGYLKEETENRSIFHCFFKSRLEFVFHSPYNQFWKIDSIRMEEGENREFIRVFCRVRPLNSKEQNGNYSGSKNNLMSRFFDLYIKSFAFCHLYKWESIQP